MTINTQKLRAFRQSLKRCASNTGHGHVYMRPDGLVAKCGGPTLCAECTKDLALLMASDGYEPPTTDDLIDHIDAQAAEIARLKSAQTWHPIDTAPEDGRTILLGGVNSHGKWRTMRGQWMSKDYIAESWEDSDEVEPGWFETAVEAEDPPNCWRIEPTHWMPLPAGPDALSGAQP